MGGSIMDYKIEEDESYVMIWDNVEGVGLRFRKGDSMQRYTSEVLVKNQDLLTTENGVVRVNEVSDEIRNYAETIYPKEFAPIKAITYKVTDYPIYKRKTDEILRYMKEEDASADLLEEIAHHNVTRIEQDENGKLYYKIKENIHDTFLVQTEVGLKKGFLGYFKPQKEDIEHFKDNELLAAQYAVNIGTRYDSKEQVYVSPVGTIWESTFKDLAERTVVLMINDEECIYHFKRRWK